jgi:hypothetical protein
MTCSGTVYFALLYFTLPILHTQSKPILNKTCFKYLLLFSFRCICLFLTSPHILSIGSYFKRDYETQRKKIIWLQGVEWIHLTLWLRIGTRGGLLWTWKRRKISVFWVVAPCNLVEVYQRFGGSCCLHHPGDESRTSETLVNFYQTTRRYNPEDSHLRTHEFD